MHRSRSQELLPLDFEIERTLCSLRRVNREREQEQSEAITEGENNNSKIHANARALRD